MDATAALQILVNGLAVSSGTAVVLTRNPLHQVMGFSLYGLILALYFLLYQAPDVALSQLVIGAVLVPLMVVLTLAKLKQRQGRRAGQAGPRDRTL